MPSPLRAIPCARRLRQRGAQTVEMALVLPLFLFLAFGVVELAAAIGRYTIMVYAVEDAARYASMHGSAAGEHAASSADIVKRVKDFPGLKDATVSVLWATDDDPETLVAACPQGNAWQDSPADGGNDPGSLVCVQVELTYDFVFPLPDLALDTHMERVIAGAKAPPT